MMENKFVYHPDGSMTNFSRDIAINGRRGEGGTVSYYGEARKVIELVLKHAGKRG
jgi:hypothetical protein